MVKVAKGCRKTPVLRFSNDNLDSSDDDSDVACFMRVRIIERHRRRLATKLGDAAVAATATTDGAAVLEIAEDDNAGREIIVESADANADPKTDDEWISWTASRKKRKGKKSRYTPDSAFSSYNDTNVEADGDHSHFMSSTVSSGPIYSYGYTKYAGISYNSPSPYGYYSTPLQNYSRERMHTYNSSSHVHRGSDKPGRHVPRFYYYDERLSTTEYEYVPSYTAYQSPKRSISRVPESSSGRPRPRRPGVSSTTSTKQRKATEDDARRAGIPIGYSIKNWDPTEEPVLLLGSVFDANSLGKWIYDWSVYHHGSATPITDIAGELWLLLIQLAGKMKRIEEKTHHIKRREDQELVEDFLESGERLWRRFEKLLKLCENAMWKQYQDNLKDTADGNAGDTGESSSRERKGTSRMGKESAIVFLEVLFGRDKEMERTEKLMTWIRLWSMRFDANCEDILRSLSFDGAAHHQSAVRVTPKPGQATKDIVDAGKLNDGFDAKNASSEIMCPVAQDQGTDTDESCPGTQEEPIDGGELIAKATHSDRKDAQDGLEWQSTQTQTSDVP